MVLFEDEYCDFAIGLPPHCGILNKRISYSTGKKSVQYVVIDLATTVGLGYDWQKSFSQTDPACRKFVEGVSIDNQPFGEAMQRFLEPVGLRCEVEDGRVVLYRR